MIGNVCRLEKDVDLVVPSFKIQPETVAFMTSKKDGIIKNQELARQI